MPNQNAQTYLELPLSGNVDAAFQANLNDTLRQIALKLDSKSGGTSSSGKSSGGASTLSGGELILSVPGTLAIKSNVAPLASLPADITPVEILALVKQAPQGGKIQFQLNSAGNNYNTGTIAANQVSGDQTSGFAVIPAGSLITLDITDVPQTFPGADLSVIVRF